MSSQENSNSFVAEDDARKDGFDPNIDPQLLNEDYPRWLKHLEERLDTLTESQIIEVFTHNYPLIPMDGAIEMLRLVAGSVSQQGLQLLLAETEHFPMDYQAMGLAVLSSFWTLEERRKIIDQALSLFKGISDDYLQALIIKELVSHLPQDLVDKVYLLAQSISMLEAKVLALVCVAPLLSGSDRGDAIYNALSEAQLIVDPNSRAYSLADVVPLLSGDIKQKALDDARYAASEAGSATQKLDAMMHVSELAPDEQLKEYHSWMLDIINSEVDEFVRSDLIMQTAQFAPQLYDKLRKLAESLSDQEARNKAIIGLENLEPHHLDVNASQKAHGLEEELKAEELKAEELKAKDNKPDNARVKKARKKQPPKAKPASTKKTSKPPPPVTPSALASGDSVPTHADNPALMDELNRRPFAEVIAQSINDVYRTAKANPQIQNSKEDPGEAYFVHIHGPWGAGKTSVLNFLRQSLESPRQQDDPVWQVVYFNAWRHQSASAPWWALLKAIYRQSQGVLKKTSKWRAFKFFMAEQLWRIGIRFGAAILALAIVLWLMVFIQPFNMASNEMAKTSFEVAALILTIGGVLLGGIKNLLYGSDATVQALAELHSDPMQPVVKHFIDMVKRTGKPVAIFVDDLDRCDSQYVVELLQGLQTLFRQSNVTYVVAADRDWLRNSYESHYNQYQDSISEPGRPLGYLFLEKIFQVSVSIPRMLDIKNHYFNRLLGIEVNTDADTLKAEKHKYEAQADADFKKMSEEQIDKRIDETKDNAIQHQVYRSMAAKRAVSPKSRQRQEHFLLKYADFFEPNPRAMKRVVNAYGFHRAVSHLSDNDLNSDVLALWTIISLRWPLLADYLSANADIVDQVHNDSELNINNQPIKNLLSSDIVRNVIKGKGVPLTSRAINDMSGFARGGQGDGMR